MQRGLFLHRYYKDGLKPFRSISDLNEREIIEFMEKEFPAHTWFHEDPTKRIERRRRIERWLLDEFLCLGGKPETEHPCYFTLGESPFLREFRFYEETPREVKIPLDIFSSENISFTYP